MTTPQLIVALDNMDESAARAMAGRLSKCGVEWFKIGLELFSAAGPNLVRDFKNKDYKIFLDLKLHDIPNTVEKAARVVSGLGVELLTVHCTGGREMIRAALSGVEGTSTAVVGVTALTSLADSDLQLLGEVFTFADHGKTHPSRNRTVARLYEVSLEAGLNGIVCSPDDLAILPKVSSSGFFFVTPGIRPSFAEKNDQKSVATPAIAVRSGATHLVVGRPITAVQSMSPEDATQAILAEMKSAGS